jgi:hypothetical protein
MRGIRSNKCRYFLTILDNVLTVGKLARGEEYPGRPHSHPRDLLEEAGGSMRNLTVVDFPD